MKIEPITIDNIFVDTSLKIQEVLRNAYNVFFMDNDQANTEFSALNSEDLSNLNSAFLTCLNLMQNHCFKTNVPTPVENLTDISKHPLKRRLECGYSASEFITILEMAIAFEESTGMNATRLRRRKLKSAIKKPVNAVAYLPNSIRTDFRRFFKQSNKYSVEELYAASAFFLTQCALKEKQNGSVDEYGDIMYDLSKINTILTANSKYINGAKTTMLKRKISKK